MVASFATQEVLNFFVFSKSRCKRAENPKRERGRERRRERGGRELSTFQVFGIIILLVFEWVVRSVVCMVV